MNPDPNKEKVDRMIGEISDRIRELKDHLAEDKVTQKDLPEMIKRLEQIRDDVMKNYEKMKGSGEARWDEINREIYRDLESFNNAFSKAGHIFKPHEGTDTKL